MWVRQINLNMTEHSGQHQTPADALRRKLNKRQIEANNRLDEIASFLQSSRQQAPEPVQAPTPSPSTAAGVVHSTSSECRSPNPERFSGDVSKFGGFLFQSTILFNHSPHCFSHDGVKISFIISHLSGQALDWAESRFSSSTTYDCTFEEFLKEFKQAFNQDSDKTLNSRDLLEIKQGQRTVAEFAIDFCIKAAASGWNPPALKSAFYNALQDDLKDLLATLDEPKTLEELNSLAIRLDNRTRARAKDKRNPPVRVAVEGVSPYRPAAVPLPAAEAEPIQIGHTRLSPEERQRRINAELCLYCGAAGYFIASCPTKAKSTPSDNPPNCSAESPDIR
uniref:Ty3 transposon capsid-like protein domain-containing protein n=1 Tax=Poecilia reticulata TaxID=8081 RepID=A0A3P9NC85_POERE